MKKLLRTDLVFLGLVTLFFLGILFLEQQNNYFRDGASAIYKSKWQAIQNGQLDFEEDKIKVLFVGNSKILSGIKPLLLDSLFGGKTSTLNLAFGGKSAADALNVLRQSEEIHFDYLIMQDNFPVYAQADLEKMSFLNVRHFFRNIFYFVGRARARNISIKQWLQYTVDQCSKMIEDKGYYFIESQALTENFELPSDYSHPNDSIDQEYKFTDFTFDAEDKFIEYIKSNNAEVLIVPNYFRKGNFKAPASERLDGKEKEAFKSANINYLNEVNYELYSPDNFSDPVHLNRKGADKYTEFIYSVLKKNIDTK